ncbi:unnamed protein product, partial [Rhizoctonia solani]
MSSVAPTSRGTTRGRGRGRGRSSLSPTTNLPVATWTSSLDIPVDGTTPIDDESPVTAAPGHPVHTTHLHTTTNGNGSGNGNGAYESKRAPRKSKTEAMAAINQRSMSPESRLRAGLAPGGLTSTINLPAPKLNPRFDLSTVRTRPKIQSPQRTAPRLMDLQECPVFYPTLDEFRDPMTYIRSIHEKAVNYGIIKIVPPDEWEMPFVCDSQSFRFKTRLQRLNSIEASSRAKMSFLEQLYRYHDQGANRPSVPMINHQPLDLWLLRREVQRRGGYDTVSRNKLWGDVQRAMGYSGPSVLAAQLKAAYTRIISPYELSRAQARHDPSPNRDRRVRVFPSTAATPPSSPLTPSSSPLSEPPDDADPQAAPNPADVKMNAPNDDEGANAFSKALAQDPGPSMTFDNTPLPVAAPPSATTRKGEVSLFESVGPHYLICPRLANYVARAIAIPKCCCVMVVTKVSEDDVEREFWRLVQSSHETVEVEYGADVHSTTHGSAMPSVESHPRDPYSRDPWNVNNLPILQDSMLRYIKSDISGMTVPWTYVGMLFSTFCWHNEDHYTYSLNYMHWGETKTWYGIPGEDAQKFEDAIKSEAPDLFEAQPDLLFQLVTLMNPDRLRKAGVRVVACNQRPGEFVVTFPKAYHAGFNHGLNFNEAVNFALPEWLPLGLECAQRYQEHRKLPVFSHDELLVTVTQHALSVKNAQWLLPNFKEMVERELAQRNALVSQPSGIQSEILDESDRPEEQYQCSVCKVFCYLSQVTCACTNAVACLSHAKEMCNCHETRRTLRRRFSEVWLEDMLKEIERKAVAPAQWRERFVQAVGGPGLPSVTVLRQLAIEGEALEIPMMELKALQRCVKRAGEWSEQAAQLLDYVPPPKKRSRTDPEHQYGVEDIQRLLDEIKKLGVDAPEKARLETLFEQVQDFQQKTRPLIRKIGVGNAEDTSPLQMFEELVTMGKNLRLDLDELTKLEQLVARLQFFQILSSVNDNGLTLDQVEELLKRGYEAQVPTDHKMMMELNRKATFGGEWKARAISILAQPRPTMQDLNQLVVPVQWIPTLPDILEKLDRTRLKGREFEKRVESFLHPQHRGQVSIEEASKCAVSALKEVFFQAAEDLRALSNEAKSWEKVCEDVYCGRHQPRTNRGVIDDVYAMREDGKKFWVFKMPWFERLMRSLQAHDEWVQRLPWTRPKHPALEYDAIHRDLSSEGMGNSPPTDEACTCLCVEPVVLGEGQSAADMEVVQCDHCLAKFHAKCIEGSCPFCDHHHWNGSMDKPRKFTYLQLVAQHKAAGELTRRSSGDYRKLEMVIAKCESLARPVTTFLRQVGQQGSPDPVALAQLRHFL